MSRKILIVSFFFLLVGAAVLYFGGFLRNTTAWNAVPETAFLAVQGQDWPFWRDTSTNLLDEFWAGQQPSEAPVIAWIPVTREQVGFLAIWQSAALPPEHPVIQSSLTLGQVVLRVRLPSGVDISWARCQGLLLVSSYPVLVEDAIRQLESPLPNPGWGAGPLRTLIRPSEWPGSPFPLEGLVSASWEGPAFSGLWSIPPSWAPGNLLAGGQEASPDPVFSLLPNNLRWFFWSANRPGAWQRLVPAAETERYEKYVQPWFGGDLVWATAPAYSSTDPQFCLLKVAAGQEAQSWLNDLASLSGKLGEWEYQTYPIVQMQAEPFLPQIREGIRNPFYTRLGDWMVFSNSRSALEIWIDQYLTGQVVANDEDFLRARLQLPGLAQGWGAFSPSDGGGRIQFSCLSAPEGLRLQGLHFAAKAVHGPVTAWKVNLDADAATPPQFVWNAEKKEWLLLAQDMKGELYCFDGAGQLRWRRSVEGRIRSPFQGLDFYQNGQQQWLFNSEKAIYLLDASGQWVNQFPLRLQSPATNAVALVDFSGSGEYAFFIACENEMVYGFAKDGTPLPGWNPRDSLARVVQPLRHFQADQKDFLTLLDQQGLLHVFQRDGSRRFPPVSVGGPVISPPDVQQTPGHYRIVAADTAGKVLVVNTAGEHFNLRIGDGKSMTEFAFANLLGDERKEFIGLAGSRIWVYGYSGKEFKLQWSKRLEAEQDELVACYPVGAAKALLGTVCLSRKQLTLFGSDGQIAPGFPVAGTGAFSVADLFGPGQPALAVAADNSIYVYRLNLPPN